MKLGVEQLQKTDGEVVAGRYQWFPKPEAAADFTTTMNNFYTTNWPREMTIDSTWICDLRETTGDGVRFLVYYDGNENGFKKLIDDNIKQKELAKQLGRQSLPGESTRFLHETLVAQWSEETTRAFPSNKTYSIYSSFVFNNNKDSINRITAIIREEMKTFRSLYTGEKVELLVTWIHSGGKAGDKAPSDTAFFWREAVYHTYVTLEWEDKWMERDMRGFLGEVKKKLRLLSLNQEAAFIKFPDRVLPKNVHERAYFGENYAELRRIKEIWDKDGFFEWDQGVQLPQAMVSYLMSNVGTPNEEDMTDLIASEQWEFFEPKDFDQNFKEMAKGF